MDRNGLAGKVGDWRPVCQALDGVARGDGAAARRFFEKLFRPYAVTLAGDRSGDGRSGLFTGYFVPELRGARERGGRYQVPLYRRPADLATIDLGRFDESLSGRILSGRVADGRVLPYPTRREIDAGAIKDQAAPLLWVDSAVDAFFLHIQGSGLVTLDDGTAVGVGYAATNGRPYTAIGRILADQGAIPRDRVSMQTIRAWLAAHPGRAADIMAQNDRYVFFRRLPDEVPVGAQGVGLTAERSLAVDRKFIPLGVPMWVDTTDPVDPVQPFRRLMIAQDTGGAIRGVVRGDIFFGYGRLAARRAGLMKQHGRYYILLPRSIEPTS